MFTETAQPARFASAKACLDIHIIISSNIFTARNLINDTCFFFKETYSSIHCFASLSFNTFSLYFPVDISKCLNWHGRVIASSMASRNQPPRVAANAQLIQAFMTITFCTCIWHQFPFRTLISHLISDWLKI